MNVSKEADRAFMLELKRTDPARYARLEKAIRVGAIQARQVGQQATQRRCQQCNLVLPADIRVDAKFCDTTCQRNARRSKTAA